MIGAFFIGPLFSLALSHCKDPSHQAIAAVQRTKLTLTVQAGLLQLSFTWNVCF